MALSLGQKAGWGLADMGIVVFVMLKQLIILDFLTNHLGVPVEIAGWLTTLVLIFDIITDPIIGAASDKTRSWFGRRAPWIATGAVVMVLGILGMFTAPAAEDGAWTGPVFWVGGFFVLATIGFTMAAIPYAATAGEMTDDPQERSRMLAWRMVFASLGILIGGGLFPMLTGGTKAGHMSAALIIAPIVILSIWVSLWSTRNAPRIEHPTQVSPARMLGLVVSNRPFLILVVLYGIMTMAIAQITAGMPFASKNLVSGEIAGLPTLTALFAPFVLGAMISQPLWAFISIRISKLVALSIGIVGYCIVLTLLMAELPSNSIQAVMLLMFGAGIANGAYQAIPWAMYPDLMDVTREESGEAIEGAFSAVWLFGQKVANALAPGILAMIIGASGWKETTEGVTEQTPEALQALEWAMTTVPIGIFVVAFVGLIVIYRPKAAALLSR